MGCVRAVSWPSLGRLLLAVSLCAVPVSQARGDDSTTTAAAVQPPAPSAESTRASAAAEFAKAHQAFESTDYERALRHYSRAYELLPHPSTLYNLALTHERLLDYEAAAQAFAQFLAMPLSEEADAARLQQTHRRLAERSLKRLRDLPARVSASAVPDEATVTVQPIGEDGQTGHVMTQIKTPGIFTVPAGRYRLRYSKEGYFPDEVDFDAHIGQALLFSRQLKAKPRSVRLTTSPPAKLFLDDRYLGMTPQLLSVDLGSHRLRIERPFYLTQLRPLELQAGSGTLEFGLQLTPSGRMDMIAGGAIAGAGLGLMVLRLFQGEIENIENMPLREIYKPLVAAALPAVVGATVAGLAGWEMPVSEAQLLIGSGAWGTVIGFGVGLGAQPQWLLPHVLAVGGGLVGGTVGMAVWRFAKPGGGPVAVWNSAVLWSAHIGALSWAYVITQKPEAAFLGRPPDGRTGEGGFAMLGSTLLGVGLGIGLAHIPQFATLNRRQVAYVDLGGFAGGALFGLVGLGAGYAKTHDLLDSTRIAIPAAMVGIGAGLVTSALLVRRLLPSLQIPTDNGPLIELKSPSLSFVPAGPGGMTVSASLLDGKW